MSSKAAQALENPVPHAIEAERSVLGAVLLDNAALAKAAEHVHSGDFFLSQHERIFRKMLAMADAQRPIDLTILIEELHAAGELDGAGGAPYLASLADGMPKVSNVEHYAKIVAEKSRLRKIIHISNDLSKEAFASNASSSELLGKLDSFVKGANSNGFAGDRKLVAVDVLDFLVMKLDPIDFVIEPILPVSNSAMIFAPPGAGKTYIMLYMSYSVAIGLPQCFVWDIPKARPVVYVDGEMDQLTLQERQTEIAKAFVPVLPGRGMMKIITPDQQPKFPPRINTKDGRARIEDHCTEGSLLVLDNLFTLCPGADEKETEDWAVMQEWILYLRKKHISVFMIQHANRTGDQQYGTSKREVQLSCNLMLRVASDYSPEQGLRVEARLKKLRRRGKDGRFDSRWVQPFEISYRVVDGAAEFSTRPMKEIMKKRAVECLLVGMRESDIVSETGLDRFTIYRLKQKLKNDGKAAAEADA